MVSSVTNRFAVMAAPTGNNKSCPNLSQVLPRILVTKVSPICTQQTITCSKSIIKTLEKDVNTFKVNNKSTRTTYLSLFWYFFWWLGTYFTPFSIVSIVYLGNNQLVILKSIVSQVPSLIPKSRQVYDTYIDIYILILFIHKPALDCPSMLLINKRFQLASHKVSSMTYISIIKTLVNIKTKLRPPQQKKPKKLNCRHLSRATLIFSAS